jgi:chitin disaccharide deacetylase
MRSVIVVILGICPMLAAEEPTAMTKPTTQPRTAAQVLGFGPQEKLLIIHADDAGMCHAHNRATIDGMEKGVINSSSIMMPCPWIMEAIDYYKKNPSADFGVHMTLNSEWKNYRWRPVAPRDKVKGLIDEEGYIWGDTRESATHASGAEVEVELRAQVQRALDLGIKPTHLDSHMGTVFVRPDFFAAYRKVALEFGIPYMLPMISPAEMGKLPAAVRLVAQQIAGPLLDNGEVTVDHLERGFSGRGPLSEQKDYYMDVIRKLKPGITQIILHPAYDGEELQAISGTHARRFGDFKVFTDPDVAQLIKDENVRLITWREIGQAQAKLRERRGQQAPASQPKGS